MRLLLIILLLLPMWRDTALAFAELKMAKGELVLPADGSELTKVTGEAQMLWNVLATPEEFPAQESTALDVAFPATWDSLASLGVTPQGQATYRLRIHVPEALWGQALGIWLPRTMGPSTTWLNGDIVIAHDFGPDGANILDRSPGHNRIYFTPHAAEQTLVIQTFNRHIHAGGFYDKFLIGPAQALRMHSLKLMAFDFLVFGLLIFSAVYHLWIYTFRRKFIVYRDLGLFFLAVVLRIFATGSSHWFSELGFNEILVLKLGWSSYYSLLLLGMQLLQAMYPAETPKRLSQGIRAVSLLAVIIVIVTPLSVSHLILRPMQIFTLLIAIPMGWCLFRAYFNRRPGTLVLLPASFLLLVMAMIEIYNSVNRIDQTFSLLGMGVLLFSLGASVFQSLDFDRTFSMVERQTRGIAGLNRKLRKQAELLEKRIEQKNGELGTLLHSLPEGVLLIENTAAGALTVGAHASGSMKKILATDTITWPQVQAFVQKSQLDSDQRAQLEATLLAVLDDDSISFDLNAENLPLELSLPLDTGTLTYLCGWAPVIIEDRVHAILLVLVDVSGERSFYDQFAQDQQIFDRLVHMLSYEPESLNTFMQEASQIVARFRTQGPDRAALLRDLHTLKGLARSFGLLPLAKAAHELESRWTGRQTPAFDNLLSVWDAHEEALAMLRVETKTNPAQQIEEDSLLVCGQMVASHREPPSEIWQATWQAYLGTLFVRADTLILSLNEGLHEVAQQLGKVFPQLAIEGGETGIRRSVQGKLIGGLNHILRNSLDHGLEGSAERLQMQKPGQGTIFIKIQFREKILIDIHDDGRGLNLEKIRARAVEKGLIRAADKCSDEQIAQFVFMPGFSTRTEVDDVSGRGIGMDAVQAAIQQMGGHIRIVWRERRNPQGCRQGTWSISLPRRYGFHEVGS